nr:unnamed protein product [Callosobruchus analis]
MSNFPRFGNITTFVRLHGIGTYPSVRLALKIALSLHAKKCLKPPGAELRIELVSEEGVFCDHSESV